MSFARQLRRKKEREIAKRHEQHSKRNRKLRKQGIKREPRINFGKEPGIKAGVDFSGIANAHSPSVPVGGENGSPAILPETISDVQGGTT